MTPPLVLVSAVYICSVPHLHKATMEYTTQLYPVVLITANCNVWTLQNIYYLFPISIYIVQTSCNTCVRQVLP